jgi:predicted TIM-barrel fold metal-dependent hydrolase
VLTLVDSYQRWLNVFFELSKDLAQHDIEKILSTNANRFYRLT